MARGSKVELGRGVFMCQSFSVSLAGQDEELPHAVRQREVTGHTRYSIPHDVTPVPIATAKCVPQHTADLAVPLSWSLGSVDRRLCVPTFRWVCPFTENVVTVPVKPFGVYADVMETDRR